MPQDKPSPPSEIKIKIESLLNKHFNKRELEAENISDSYKFMWSAIKSTALAGGKRWRPYLCSLSYSAHDGKNPNKALIAGTALELLHICLLIHDDIMDKDYMRHGKPNVEGLYREDYKQYLANSVNLDHAAASAAILAGDLLLSESYQLLLTAGIDPQKLPAAINLMHEAIFGVAGGQLMDSESPFFSPEDVDGLKIAEYKTAVYSCSVPFAMGALLAGASHKEVATWHEIGRNIGIAFQLADDLLGTFGDEALTGKSNLSDLRQNKRTYLLQQAYSLASPDQLREMNTILDNPSSTLSDYESVKTIIIDTGAVSAVETKIDAYANRSIALAKSLPLDEPHRRSLDEFISAATKRSA